MSEETIFENIKHIDEFGNEYWNARELQKTLEYKEWRKFEGVIKKAITSCKGSNYNIDDHFVRADKMIELAKGANLFRITQTDAKLKKDNINNDEYANITHYNIGKDVRKFIKKQGNTMPENLPPPNKSLKEIKKETVK